MSADPKRRGRPRATCGTAAAYKAHRRRKETPCDPCAEAWRQAHPPRSTRDERRTAFHANQTDPRHGTANGYANLGCRCQPCRDAWALNHAAYLDRHPEQRIAATLRERRRRGSPDLTPAQMGLVSIDQAAKMFGVSRYQICRLDLPTCLTTGRRMYYQPSDVLAVLQARCAAEYGSAITALVVAAARLDALLEADE